MTNIQLIDFRTDRNADVQHIDWATAFERLDPTGMAGVMWDRLAPRLPDNLSIRMIIWSETRVDFGDAVILAIDGKNYAHNKWLYRFEDNRWAPGDSNGSGRDA